MLAVAESSELARVVSLDPAVVRSIADFLAQQADDPLACSDAAATSSSRSGGLR